MKRLIYGRYTDSGNLALARWAALRIPYVDAKLPEPFGPAECVGVEHDRRLVASVVFHFWDPVHHTLMVSMASSTPMWARPETISDILAVPFEMIGARKIYTWIRSDNVRAIRFNEKLGFKREANLSEHFGPKLHAVVFGMKRHHYDRLKVRLSGKADIRAACA